MSSTDLYNELMKKYSGSGGSNGQTAAQSTSDDSEQIYNSLMEKYTKEVDEEYAKTFYDDYNRFLEEVKENTKGITYENGKTIYESNAASLQDLIERSKVISNNISSNSKATEKQKKDAQNVVDTLNQIAKDLQNTQKMYSAYDSEEAYNSAKQEYEWQNKYKNMDSGELESILGSVADEKEKAWLDKYRQYLDYEERRNLDKDAYDRETRILEKALEDYNYLSRWEQDAQGKARLEEILSQYGSADEIGKKIDERNAYSLAAKLIQEKEAGKETYEAIREMADFEKFSQYDPAKQEIGYEYINADFAKREDLKQKYGQYVEGFEDAALDSLSEEEKETYNYLMNTGNRQGAADYLKYLKEELGYRKAEEQFAGYDDHKFMEYVFGIEAGLDQARAGMQGFGNLIAGREDYVPANYKQQLSGMIREDLGDGRVNLPGVLGGGTVGQAWYDAITTTANMAPSIVASTAIGLVNPAVGGYVGKAILGMTASGNAYQEAINSGFSKDQARGYGLAVGASEVIMEELLGGISALGKGKLSGAVIDNLNVYDNAVKRFCANIGGSLMSEFGEEYLQEVLGPAIKNIFLGTHEDVKLVSADALYAGFLGALTAFVMETPTAAMDAIGVKVTGKSLQDVNAQNRLAELGKTFSADSLAYQLAGKVDANTDAFTLGRLFNEIGATLSEQNKADITNAILAEIGDTMDAATAQKIARENAEVMGRIIDGEKVSKKQKAVIEKNDVLAKVAVEVLVNENSTVNQRMRGYSAVSQSMVSGRDIGGAKAQTPAATADKKEAVEKKSYDLGGTGKTTYIPDGKEVKIREIDSLKDGQMQLKLEDGRTVDAKDVGYASESEALVYESIAKMDTNAAAANALVRGYDPSSGVTAEVYVKGVEEAYRYGQYGYPDTKGPFSSMLTESQRTMAYKLGKLFSGQQVAKEQEMVRKPKGSAKANVKGGVFFEGADGSVTDWNTLKNKPGLKPTQETAIQTMRVLSQALGIKFYVGDYSNRTSGNGKGINGFYNTKDSSIHIDLNAGMDSQKTMLFTLGHELTHFIRQWSPAKFKVLANFLMEEFSQYNNMDAWVHAKMKETGLKYPEAYEEVVADAMEAMLADGKVMEKLLKLKKKDREVWQKIKFFIDSWLTKLKDAYAGLKPDSAEGKAVLEMTDKLEEIQQLFAEGLVEASENYQAAFDDTGDAQLSNDEAFLDSAASVKNQIRPPYADGSKAFNAFVDGMKPEAKETFDLFYGFYQRSRITNTVSVSGKHVKAVNISSLYLLAQDWNAMLAKEPKWASAAKALADFLPADVRKRMNMNADGTLNPTTMEKEFKMPSSMAQRLVDALPYEGIDAEYRLGDKTVTLPDGKARQSVGGEAYRRAILEETRKLFSEGKLKPVGIGTMSKDRWGSLGFLAANGKTGASGDFTTVCPQMMFNRGCWYCYRRAAMEKGVNNKLVANSVWYTGEILRIKQSDIDSMNRNGGLRIQSFGDWMPHFSAMLADVLYDAELRGLQVKIFTKEPSMINYIAALRAQGIGKNLYFNLSADYTIERGPAKQAQDGNSLDAVNPERPYMRDADNSFWWKRAMTVEEAAKYREKYPWVNTRIVATDVDEFIRGLKDNRVDVVTGYHGNIRGIERIDSTTGSRKIEVEALGDAGMPRFAFNPVTGKWVTEYEGKTATHKRLAQAIADNGLQMEYYTKTCCITGRCATCEGKCGALARDFNVKNATNRDTQSIAYWQKQMEYAVEPEFGDLTVEPDGGIKYSAKTAMESDSKKHPYSYETLISKPDMTVTLVGGNIPKNRADVVAQAKKNAAEVGKFNPKDGSVSVRVNDIDRDVILGTAGLKHSLDRRMDVNASITLMAGKILQNSIKINELTPQKAEADESYVLIGAAKNSDGELFVVRSVVNRFSNELASMDVLYAINAKKENRLRSMRPGFQGPVTDSAISIADLLESVNQYFPEVLPEDVLKHFGHDARPDGKLGESALYSVKNSENLSNRSLLMRVDESSLEHPVEAKRLREYKDTVAQAEAQEKILEDLNRQIRDEVDQKKVKKLQIEAKQTVNRLAILDKKILQKEAELKTVLEREQKMAYLQGEQKRADAYEKYRIETEVEHLKTMREYRATRAELHDLKDDTKVMEKEFIRIVKEYEKQGEQAQKQAGKDAGTIAKLQKKLDEEARKHKEESATWQKEFNRLLREYDAAGRNIERLETQVQRQRQSAKEKVNSRKKTELRQKIRKVIMDLDKILNRGDKKRNVKEGMKGFVAEALKSAEILFTEYYSNEDMLRNGVGTDLTPEEAKLLKEAKEILNKIANLPTGYEGYLARQEQEQKLKGQLSSRMAKLKNVFIRERERLNKTKVSTVLGNLADTYGQLKDSEQAEVQGAYHEGVYEYLKMLQEDIGGTVIKDMTLDQLEELYKAYTMVMTTVRNANKMFAENLNATREALAKDVMREVKTVGGERKLWWNWGDKLNRFSWNNEKPVYAFERIGSNTLKALYGNIRRGQDTWATDLQEANRFRQEIWGKYNYSKWDRSKEYKFTSSSGVDFELNLEQIMSIYAYSKREQAYDHLMKGGFVFDSETEVTVTKYKIPLKFLKKNATAYNLSLETLEEIISKLTPEQRSFVDEMQDYLSSTMGEKGNEVSMKLYGVKLFNEQFYFPLRSAGQYMERAREADLKKEQGQVNLVNSGFSKATKVKASNPVVLNGFMDVWAGHVNEMSMYHSFVLPMEDFRRVYNYSTPHTEEMQSVSVNGVIQNAYGKAATDYIDQLYRDLNGGALTDNRTGFINAAMGLFKKGAVFASLSVTVQQPSAIARASALIDSKYFIGTRVDAKKHKETWAEVKRYAPVATIKEMGFFDTNMGRSATDFLTSQEYSGILEKAKALVTDEAYRDELLSKAPALADEITWCAIWEAVKRETKDKHRGMDVKSEAFLKIAGERFSEVIDKTQVYDSVLARSANMRSKDTGMKMATAFMAEPTTSINMVMDALRKGKQGNRKQARKIIGSVVASVILNSFLVSWVYAARDDDEDETYREKYLSAFFSSIKDGLNPMTYIPFIKDIVSIVQGYEVERSDMAVISDLWNAWKQLESDDVSAWKKVEGFVGSICQIIGLPVKNIMRDVRSVYQAIDIIRNGEENTVKGSAYAIVEGITGKKPSNSEQLYKSRVEGDEEHEARVEGRYDDEDSANAAVRKEITARYMDDELTLAQATMELTQYAGMKPDEAYWLMDGWKHKKETGSDDYNKYDAFYEAVETGKDLKEVIKTYTDNGVKEQTLSGQITEHFKEQYVAMSAADRAALKGYLINAYEQTGMSREKATEKLKEWDFEAKYGFAYSDRKQAYLNGDISAATLKTILVKEGGYTAEDAALQVEAYEWEKTGISGATSAAVRDYNLYCKSAGVSKDMFMKIRKYSNDTDNDVDANGKSIAYSAMKKVMAEINKLPISTAKKEALAKSMGWKDSNIKKYAPWR